MRRVWGSDPPQSLIYLPSSSDEAEDAIHAPLALHTACMPEIVKMGDRLADSEGLLMQIERPMEEHRKQVYGMARLRQGLAAVV